MTEQLTLTLSIDHCNIILASLAKQPFEAVVDVITEIRKQASEQMPAEPEVVVQEQ